MAMACALSISVASLALASASSAAAPDTLRSCSWFSISRGSLRVSTLKVCRIGSVERRNAATKASAAEGAVSQVSAEAAVEVPSDPIAALKLQSDILKKAKKKEELKRKRLVRKRHLRKAGRWPPSKLKKNKNV